MKFMEILRAMAYGADAKLFPKSEADITKSSVNAINWNANVGRGQKND